MSLRDKILSASDIKSEKIYIEEWDAEVELRSLNGTQRARIMSESFDSKAKQISWDYALLAMYAMYDPETGTRIFSDSDKEALNEKHGGILENIAMKILKLSGLSDESLTEAEKNF